MIRSRTSVYCRHTTLKSGTHVGEIVDDDLNDQLLASRLLLSASISEVGAESWDFVGGIEPGEGGDVGNLSHLGSEGSVTRSLEGSGLGSDLSSVVRGQIDIIAGKRIVRRRGDRGS